MIDIKSLPQDKLKDFLVSQNERPFHAQNIYQWLFQKGAVSFSEMTDLPNRLRQKLEHLCDITTFTLAERQLSLDGTQKFLFELKDKNTIESVYIPSDDRVTLCMSSQVGCRMGCKFCLTAKQGIIRNLAASEIVSQLMEVQSRVDRKITNIVMMGMGEPLDNYENVMNALLILQSKWAFKFSQRKITVSTVGLVPKIIQFGKDTDVNLAISLNAPSDSIRSQIMPMNKRYSMDEILDACRRYPLKPGRRITFEYVMLGDLNDSLAHARELSLKIKDLKCKINLIPFNEHPKSPFKRPSDLVVNAFQQYLIDHHISVFIRKSRGRDILAACGQLVSQNYAQKHFGVGAEEDEPLLTSLNQDGIHNQVVDVMWH